VCYVRDVSLAIEIAASILSPAVIRQFIGELAVLRWVSIIVDQLN
jgi:hypothetical protein